MLYLVRTPQDEGNRHFLVRVEKGELISEKLKQILSESLVEKCQTFREFEEIAPGVYEVYQITAAFHDLGLSIRS